MATRRPGRHWPNPLRTINAEDVGSAVWEELLSIAGIESGSKDACNAIGKLKAVLRSVRVTADGRFVTEARPRPAEIRDPLEVDGIPGAEALARYLANADEDSIHLILTEGLDQAYKRTGLEAGPYGERSKLLVFSAMYLRFLLPALVQARNSSASRVRTGRPPVPRRETQSVAIELATIWAEHSDAEPEAFHRFVVRFFALCGVEKPKRTQYEGAVEAEGDFLGMSAAELEHVRLQQREERRRLVGDCGKWMQVPFIVQQFAREALEIAARMREDASTSDAAGGRVS